MSFPSFLSLPGAPVFAGSDTGSSFSSLAITPGASNTQGASVEIASALPYDVAEVWLLIQESIQRAAIQFMVGASGSETPASAEIVTGHSAAMIRQASFLRFPIAIPRGVRLSARLRGNAGSPAAARFQVCLVPSSGRNPQGFASSWTVGYAPSTTQPTVLSWGGAADTYGAATELTTSTPARANAIFISAGGGNSATSIDRFTVQIGIDPSGTPTFPPTAPIGGTEILIPRANDVFNITLPCHIPAGSRLWARYKGSAATNIGLSLSLTGFY